MFGSGVQQGKISYRFYCLWTDDYCEYLQNTVCIWCLVSVNKTRYFKYLCYSMLSFHLPKLYSWKKKIDVMKETFLDQWSNLLSKNLLQWLFPTSSFLQSWNGFLQIDLFALLWVDKKTCFYFIWMIKHWLQGGTILCNKRYQQCSFYYWFLMTKTEKWETCTSI